MICCGCDFQHQLKSGKWADAGQTQEVLVQAPTCAFCRTAVSPSDEETLSRLRKRAKGDDPIAMHNLFGHGNGDYGLPVEQTKCIDLLRQAAGLGLPVAHYQLGNYHLDGAMGLEQNEEEAIKYWEKAAEGGHLTSRHNLGISAYNNDNHIATLRHWRLSASGGYRSSMEGLLICYEDGLLHHSDLAETLQAMYLARAEIWSEERYTHIEHLKTKGEYNAEYVQQ